MKTHDQILAEHEEKEKNRQKNILAKKTKSKANKRKLLMMQNGACALCQEPIPSTAQHCFDSKTQSIICRPCTMYLNTWRNYRAKGITEDRTVEFDTVKEGE